MKVFWNLIAAYLILLLIREVFWFVRDNFTIISVSLLAFISFISFFLQLNKKSAEAKRQENKILMDKVLQTTRSDSLKGFNIDDDLGWISVQNCESSKEVDEQLKIKAARLGGNGIIKLHWINRKESYIAGHGKKGNPYYQNRTIYDGEGVAVSITKKNTLRKMQQFSGLRPLSQPVAAGYPSGWIAIDGNNLFGEIYKTNDDPLVSFQIMRKYILNLQNSPYKVHMFWDGNFIKFAHALKIAPQNINLTEILTTNLSIMKDSLTVSDFGQRVDDLIVTWAHMKTCAIISNDNYSKDYEDQLIMVKSKQLRDQGLVLKAHVVAGEIVVPELTSI